MDKNITVPLSPLLLVAALFFVSITADSLPPAPAESPASSDCMTQLLGLADCLTYVEEGSKVRKPESACCKELGTLVNNDPICLCKLVGGNSSFAGVQIDTPKALKLPKACNISTPPFSLCSALGPAVSPASTESPASSSSPGDREVAPAAGTPTPQNNGGSHSERLFSFLPYLLFSLTFLL